MRTHTIRSLIVAFIPLIATVSCSNPTSARNVNAGTPSNQTHSISVLYAGSMTNVMEKAIRVDVHSTDHIAIAGEGAGSRALAQLIASGLRNPDVFISASPRVNETLLMGPSHGNLEPWYITLARDEMVIAYAPKSKFSNVLNEARQQTTPWYQVLQQPGFLLGRTDPKLDPKGVNTILTMKLAAAYYHAPSLMQQVIGTPNNTSQVYPEEALLSRLSTGQVDAVFAYKHEAVEWGFPYISLPRQINLGDNQFANQYASVSYTDELGNSQKGAPIVFTISVLSHASDPKTAVDFVKYMLVGRGHTLLLQHGFGALSPTFSGTPDSLPVALRDIVHKTFPPSKGGQS